MYPPLLRFILIAVATIWGLVSFPRNPTLGGLFLVGASFLLVGYFRQGTVWLAFRAGKSGNKEKALRLLGQVKKPEWLSRQNRAYYYFLLGSIALEEERGTDAYFNLSRAADLDLRTDNDRGLVQAMLAAAASLNGETSVALNHLQNAKSFPPHPQGENLIREIEAELQGPDQPAT